jgi:hypothetical protein
MRVRWEAPDPVAAAQRVGEALGVTAEQVRDHPEIVLGSGVVEFRPTVAADGDERLRIAGLRERLPRRAGSPRADLVGVGWATVEVQRAAGDLEWETEPGAPDTLLGATAAVVTGDRRLLLLEPSTEGRIAASLVRWGEGPAALYVSVGDEAALERARRDLLGRGGRSTVIAEGPFGRSFAALVGPAWGPHLVLVERASAIPAAVTIRP